MEIKLLSITPNAEKLIEYAGRVCWRSELSPDEDGTAKFIRALIQRGHLSVIEHASATFEIGGISRACSHQIVRHRLASYSQESQRYVEAASTNELVTPESIVTNDGASFIYTNFLQMALLAYSRLRNLGIKKEDARFVLPNAMTTRIVVTMNFRTWRHFIEMRCDQHAQWEIRAIATEILGLLYENAPSVFDDLYEQFLEG